MPLVYNLNPQTVTIWANRIAFQRLNKKNCFLYPCILTNQYGYRIYVNQVEILIL